MNDKFIGTRPVAPQHAFNLERLQTWMAEHVEGFQGPLSVDQFKGGQSNPTFLLRTPQHSYVLRRKPPGILLPSAHAVDREYRVIGALTKTNVPVAKTYALCEEVCVIGTAFYVMDHIQGRILWDPTMPDAKPDQRSAMFDEMNRVISALHTIDYQAVGLGDYGKPGSYLGRQVTRWTKQYLAAETEKIEAMDKLIAWLPEHIPVGDETSIVHGDYRLDNVIFDPVEPRILAVLDWELSTLGHPLVDFAYHCMTWRLPPGHFRGLLGQDLHALGIPGEAEYVAAYCQRTGRPPIPEGDWEYYIIFNMFRLAGILQGITARGQQGNASSQEAIDMGKQTRPLAEAAWAQVERLMQRI